MERQRLFERPGMNGDLAEFFFKPTQEKQEAMKREALQILDILQQTECKEHLRNIYLGRIYSSQHNLFMNNRQQDPALSGSGPLAGDQIMQLLNILEEFLYEVDPSLSLEQRLEYVLSVWFFEGIVYAIQVIRNIGRLEAERVFIKDSFVTFMEQFLARYG